MGTGATDDPARRATADLSGVYELVAELTTDYIYSMVPSSDDGFDLEYVSDGFARVTGYRPDEIGAHWERLVHPEDLDVAAAGLARLGQGSSISQQIRLVAKDGRTIWIRGYTQPVFDPSGRLVRVVGAARNVTSEEMATARSRLLMTVARIANEEISLEVALGLSLGAVCDLTGWEAGHAFLLEGEELVPTGFWHDDGSDIDPLKAATAAMRPLAAATLPRRVLGSGRPLSITEDDFYPDFARREAARSCGIRSIHLFPLLSLDKPVGVVEFFTRAAARIDPEIEALMSSVGVQLGRTVERNRAAAELANSEERLRSLAETARDVIISIDGTGAIRYVNPAVESAFGYSADELQDAPVSMLVPEPLRESFPEKLAAVLASLEDVSATGLVQARVRRKDGSEVPVEISLSRSVTDGDDLFTGIARDISERLRVEQELARKEVQLEEAQFMTGMGSWELNVSTGVFLYSKGLLKMLGLPLDAEPRFTDLQAMVHPTDLQGLVEMSTAVASSGGGRFDHSFRVVRPDGAVRTIHTRGEIEATPDGSIGRIVAVDRDVTEQHQAGRLLTHQAEVLRMMAEGDPVELVLDTIARKIEGEAEEALCSILVVDESRERLYYGAAPSLSATFKEATDGTPIADGAGCCGTAAYSKEECLARDLSTDPNWTDYRAVTAPEGLRSCWSVAVLSSEGHGVLGTFALYRRRVGEPTQRDRDLVAFFSDLVAIAIERKRTEETNRALELRYRESQKMEAIGRLAGGVAHDFNNLLQAVMGSARLVSDSLDETDPRREDAEAIVSASIRGATLVRQLLTFARREILEPKVVDLNDVVAEATRLLKAAVGDSIALTIELDDRPAPVRIDPAAPQQILLNLVRNAVFATGSEGQIWIRTVGDASRCGGSAEQVALIVGDDGCGMDPSIVDRIFEPFFTTRPPGEGSGLGLASVFGSVQAAGGAIRVETEPGNGAVVKIFLPASEAPAGDDHSPADVVRAEKDRLSGDPVTVLLAEDDAVVARVFRKALERVGCRVLVAEDGTSALALAMSDTAPVDVVVTDVKMPGLSGPEVVSRLRATGRSVRALYVSGYSEEDLDHRTFDEDDAYIAKPLTPDDLVAAVRALSARR